MLELQQRNEGGEFGVDLFWFGLKINDILLPGLNEKGKMLWYPKSDKFDWLVGFAKGKQSKSEKEKFIWAIIVSWRREKCLRHNRNNEKNEKED